MGGTGTASIRAEDLTRGAALPLPVRYATNPMSKLPR